MPWKSSSKPVRFFYAGMYLFFSIAGIFAFIFPSQTLLTAPLTWVAYAWATFLTTGGITSLLSPVLNRWGGEMIGLPLLSSSSAIFGTTLFAVGQTAFSLALGFLFLGVGIGLLGRWLDILRKNKVARRVGNGAP